MPEYLSPGVYVEEIDRGPKPIEGVGTSTACFVGFTEKAQETVRVNGENVTRDLFNKPQLVTNWTQYLEKFGGFVSGAYLPQAVYGFFMNGGARCYVLSVKTIPKAQVGLLNADGKTSIVAQAAVAGYEGAKLRVRIDAPVLPPASGDRKKSKPATDGAAPADGAPVADAPAPLTANVDPYFHITVERERANGSWKAEESFRNVTLAEVETADGKKPAIAWPNGKRPQLVELIITDEAAPLARIYPREQQQSLNIDAKQLAPATVSEFQGEALERTGIEALEAIDDINILAVPDLMATAPGQSLDLNAVKAVQTMLIAHCERAGGRVAVLDAPPNMNPQQIKNWRMDTAGYDSSYAALYWPWVEVNDPITNQPALVPPSGHVAGIWARSDNTRGVHKAPANEVVRGATGLAYNATKGEQDVLNPNGVNCIRAFPGMGIRVWGARTLTSNPSWRYINVRRLFNFVEKSIERSTQWVVFEPNEPRLWARIRRDAGAFLTTVWRDGALFGLSPSEAFYVKCDAELNPPESRDLGRLVIEIGMAPVKPAEFVIFRISQWQPGMEG
jgi:phage tail sheath protein FI